ncbi:protein MGARP [Nothobranchius furzeri]|uniref:Translation initiation factor IF-2-like n=3 Tax=Nothobranchius TaxID=28779 RepID=A0A9D3BS57_NOTFU|nr:translation initiation factor IF-2-like [Nothobranchius furzeri]
MFCRRVWQRAGPLAQRIFSPASRNSAPVRHMAFGVPGGSINMTYFVLCGGGLTAAVVYAYKTVNGDTERYEDRLANMDTQAKVKEAPDAAAPVEGPAAAAEEPSPAEVIIESVPAEPAADVSAGEAATEGVAADVVEAVVTDASAESAEEAAPAAVEEAAPEAVVEAAAAETPDLLTAVKTLSSSTAEIAAASVGEENLQKAVHQKEAEATISSQEESKASEPASKEAAAAVSMEKPAEVEEYGQNPDAEEVPEETPAPVALQIEEGSSPHEETSAEEAETSQEEAVSSTEITRQDALPSEEAEDVAVSPESSQEETPAGETLEETIVEVTQLAVASAGPDLDVLSPAEPEPLSLGGPVQEEEGCRSCHAAPSAGEEVAAPAARGEELLTEEEEDPKHKCEEESSLLEEQNTENTAVLMLQS